MRWKPLKLAPIVGQSMKTQKFVLQRALRVRGPLWVIEIAEQMAMRCKEMRAGAGFLPGHSAFDAAGFAAIFCPSRIGPCCLSRDRKDF